MITDKQIRAIIADAQNKIGDFHALIFSKQAMIDICEELLRRRDADIDKEYLPTNQR